MSKFKKKKDRPDPRWASTDGTAVRWDNVNVNPLRVGPREGYQRPADDFSCRHWDDIEDLKVLQADPAHDEALALKLGRTAKAIRQRRNQLNREENA